MKNLKRIASFLLSLALVLGLCVPALAAVNDTGFSDVSANAWYADEVEYCRENGLMSGTSATEFSPNTPMTRDMLITVLYRLSGSPAVSGTSKFEDAAVGRYYYNAVLWAEQNGIAAGLSETRFGVGVPVSREQMAVFFWRYAGETAPETSAGFADQIRISTWAVDAVNWARENNVISGKGNNRFDPQGRALRCEVATVLKNYTDPAPSQEPGVLVSDGFVEISGGSFTMGSPSGEPERSSDEVQHRVTVSSFYLSPTEVTQKEYQTVMGSNPSSTKGDDLPVTDVTWYDAIAYCNALSRAGGLTEAYTIDGTTVTWNKAANGYRLPTEAEWEYAARANTNTPFHFGDYVHNSDANCYNAYGYNNDASGSWVNGPDSYLRRTVEVTRYGANAYGLYNMHGNVAEWVWDWYGEYDTQANTNPIGRSSGNAKIVRGGGWNDHPKHIRSAYRGAHPADVSLYSIGIRLARGASSSGKVTSTSGVRGAQSSGKVLIAYFSQTGNTDGLAKLIHEMSGADIFRIERATPYSSSSNGPVLYGEALDELRAEVTPAIKEYPDLSQYDTILLGYCNWWSSIPASVRTLLTENDLSGKTIVPFCSMGGGHFGQTISAIAKLVPNSTIKEGLEVSYSSYDRAKIQAWLTENGIPTK